MVLNSLSTVPLLTKAEPTAWVRYYLCQRISLAELTVVAASPDSPELCLSLQFASVPLEATIGRIILFHNLLEFRKQTTVSYCCRLLVHFFHLVLGGGFFWQLVVFLFWFGGFVGFFYT